MANQEHFDILNQGVEVWNKWREEHPEIQPDFSEADLSGYDLFQVNFNGVNLRKACLIATSCVDANFIEADLCEADLSGADFRWACLNQANLIKANLSFSDFSGAMLIMAFLNEADLIATNFSGALLTRADLSMAVLSGANLNKANLMEAYLMGAFLNAANLVDANLSKANLSEAHLNSADLTGSRVYAISAWKVELEKASQLGLIITSLEEPSTITVDNLELAQFIYLLLNNKKIREVIDTITSKVVLILGRFTPERKFILDAIRDELRKRNYTPVLFDFEKPATRDFTETVRILAYLARFIIADLTDPSSIPQELQAIVPDLEVPVQPLLLEAKREYSMFVDFRKYHWVLPIHLYKDRESLIASLQDEIIEPADKKARELAIEKAKRLERP